MSDTEFQTFLKAATDLRDAMVTFNKLKKATEGRTFDSKQIAALAAIEKEIQEEIGR